MQTDLPELRDTDAKYEAALAKQSAAHAAWETAKEVAREARRKATDAIDRVANEKAALANAQQDLTDALFAHKPPEKFQQRVSGCLANLDSLRALVDRATVEADERDREMMRLSIPLGHAQSEVEQTRFYQLVVKLAKVVQPAIAICRELEPLSHKMGQSLEASGYVLDLSRPQISRYSMLDDGTIYYYMR